MHVRARTEIGHNIAVMADANPLLNGIASARSTQSIDIVLTSETHGAFVWGVLDRFLDEPGLSFGNITASGFGAIEAAVLAYGLALGGQRGARTALTNFWRRVSHASMLTANMANPLRSILEQSIDITEIRKKGCPVKLSILASNALTDAAKVFTSDQLSIDVILAAATIPFLFPAVEIDGETYWGDSDRSTLPSVQSVEADRLLIIAGRPSGFLTPCADRRPAANHGLLKSTLIQYIFDSQYRPGAPLFTRPWIDWGELTDIRDRGRQRAEDWLLADQVLVGDRSALDSKSQYA
ncbi:patatin-like phospholipase family protein [Mesorhizobium kowhaii]|uniref:patatin-like phospholipase family protein n=1 Tax=Mesorhizobium kowhaii TaxID=1300272 RepID=UPI0035E9B9B2